MSRSHRPEYIEDIVNRLTRADTTPEEFQTALTNSIGYRKISSLQTVFEDDQKLDDYGNYSQKEVVKEVMIDSPYCLLSNEQLYAVYLAAVKDNNKKEMLKNYSYFQEIYAFICNQVLRDMKDDNPTVRNQKINELIQVVPLEGRKKMPSIIFDRIAELSPENLLQFSPKPPLSAVIQAQIVLSLNPNMNRERYSALDRIANERLNELKTILETARDQYKTAIGKDLLRRHTDSKNKIAELDKTIQLIQREIVNPRKERVIEIKTLINKHFTSKGFKESSLNMILVKLIQRDEYLRSLYPSLAKATDKKTIKEIVRNLIPPTYKQQSQQQPSVSKPPDYSRVEFDLSEPPAYSPPSPGVQVSADSKANNGQPPPYVAEENPNQPLRVHTPAEVKRSR